jgi:hypothetical protein
MAAQAVSERGQESSRLQGQQQDYQEQHSYGNDFENIGGHQRPLPRSRPDNGPLGIGRLLQQVHFFLYLLELSEVITMLMFTTESPLSHGRQHAD